MMGHETLFTWRGLLIRSDGSGTSFWVCHPEDQNGSSAYPSGLVQRDGGASWTARLTLAHTASANGRGDNVTAALEDALASLVARLPRAIEQLAGITAKGAS
jgi:hypothetical protein